MLPFIPDRGAWPFAPGESPFRIKGTAYRGHLAYVEEHVPGGVSRMLRDFGDDALAGFFSQQFLAASFYDIFPLVLAAVPCAAAMGMSASDFVARRSRAQAPKDLTGVYRFLLGMVPTRSVAKRIPQLLTQILDFGSAKVLRDAPGEVDAVLEALPSAIVPWFGTVCSAYGEAALKTSGAKHASFTTKPEMFLRADRGITLMNLPISVRWT